MKNMKSLFDMLPRRKRVYHNDYHRMAHYVYPEGATSEISVQHMEPENIKDKLAYKSIKIIRRVYDFLTNYDKDKMTEAKWIQRCLLLETVAGVPGMVAGMARHLRSLRTMERDKGWIHHLLQEADNQRFHLFIFLNIKKPGILERSFILGLQGIFFNFFFFSYLLNPKFSHRFVGYLEEQAVKTYTTMLADIDNPNGALYSWNKLDSPQQVKDYYQLGPETTMRDVISCVRADQACHRQTNHYLGTCNQSSELPNELMTVVETRNESNKQKTTQNNKDSNMK